MESTNQVVFFGSYAGEKAPGIFAFSMDSASGALTQVGSHTGIDRPSFLALHPNKRWLYAVSELAVSSNGKPGAVWALDYDAGKFRAVNQQPSGGDWPCHIVLDATSKWVFVANYGTGSASVYPIQSDGSLGVMSDHVQHQGHGPNKARQEGPHAHSTTLTPDNKFAIVADLGLDLLFMYAFDATNGKLHEHARVATRPGAGPRHMVFHPNGHVLYVANELSNTVAVYDYNAATGSLTETQSLDTLPENAPASTIADIHISSNGDRVYVSNRGHDSIAVFAVDETCKLFRAQLIPSGGKTPRNFALAPGEKFILVANQDTGDVTVFPLEKGKEEIGAAVKRVPIPTACCIKFLNHG